MTNARREADAARPPRTPVTAAVAVIIAALAVIVPVLLDAYHS